MFSFQVRKIFASLNLRYLSEGSLILRKSTEVVKRKGLLNLPHKKQTKKAPKRKRVTLKPEDEFEHLWLENLSVENIKLFRKTSYGSFRKVNLEKLLEKLRMLFPEKLGNQDEEADIKIASSENCQLLDSSSPVAEKENDLASPYVSDFLVKNMLSFPLLKSQCDNSLRIFLKDEKEEFGTVDSVKFPSVTKVLNDTMSEAAMAKLTAWKAIQIKKLGIDGFQRYQRDLLKTGSKLHTSLKKYLESGDESAVSIDPDIEGCWKSLSKVLPDISNVLIIEGAICHPVLMYKGIVDCVASYRDGPCVIEWKKSDRKKSSLSATYDAPIQLCAYLGALAWHRKAIDVEVKSGLVVTAYSNGAPATVFPMDLECCEFYWSAWLHRLQTYWAKRSSTLIQHETEG